MEDVAKATGDILVVDDTPANLVAIQAALDHHSGDLVLATSGREALRYLLERDFALILLDVAMPDMDGLETAKLIRERKRSRHVPIIFVTAYDSNDDDVLAAYRLGAVDFLFKPIHPDILRAKAQVFVDLQRHTSEIARQALLIKEQGRQVQEKALAEQRRRLEAEALRERLTEQRAHAEELEASNRKLEEANRELEEAYRRLSDANDKLASADRRKDEFLATLAHELRNPLAALMSGIALLPEDDELRRVMRRQCSHLVRLVDDLLDISRISSGKIQLKRAPCRVSAVVEQAVELLSGELEAKRHELSVEIGCPDAVIDGDMVRLTQTVANLLTNATRYTDPGGQIRLVVERDGDEISLRVIDNGRGIAPHLLESVFEPFVQAQADGAGLGLGLPLARRLVERHGGTLAVRSDGIDKGSEFELRLPESEADAAIDRPVEEPEPAVAGPPSLLKIVVVDDYDDGRMLTSAVLARDGHEVLEAANGADGVALIVAERPAVAFIDIGLPDMTGYDVARQLRDQLGDDCPRMIAITGYAQRADRDRARDAGFDAHLAKPATAEALRAALQDGR